MFKLCFHYTGIAGVAAISSLNASMSSVPSGQVCHSEVMEVTLNSWARGGFGLILHKSQGLSDLSSAPLFISYIERGSPAEKSGVLQVGDRVLAINDWCAANGTAEEANYIIRHASSPLTLTVEFDVIETVLPSSGVFTVKLVKRGQNLGIVITSSGVGQKGEPVTVSDVRTGSVAHRCGSIHPGDQLLAIDNIPLDACTVEEAVRLLQRSSDIVKLRVKKSLALLHEETDCSPQTIVYSVELSRRGGPLGITIASTDERGDPVIISQLAPGGLAERTGALHVGDRLLAINSQSLQGKRVSEAMQMLQGAGETVALKIARYVDPPFSYQSAQQRIGGLSAFHDHFMLTERDPSDKLGTPVQSIDSAVESLEDSPVIDGVHQPSASNRNSQNSKTSSLTGDQSKYAEELSAHLQKSLTTLSKSPARTGEVGSVASSGHQSSDHGGDSGVGCSESGDQFCGCTCQQSSPPDQNVQGGSREDWIRVLEALETVGEAEMLKKLEESIMVGGATEPISGQKPNHPGSVLSPPFPTGTILRHPHMSQAQQLLRPRTDSCGSSHSTSSTSSPGPPPKPPLLHPQSSPLRISTLLRSFDNIPFITSPVGDCEQPGRLAAAGTPDGSTVSSIQLSGGSLTPSADQQFASDSAGSGSQLDTNPANPFPTPGSVSNVPLELFRVTLFKDRDYNDFGFSVSDGAQDKGIYINKIRAGGPAELSGVLKPFDRILQVNQTSMRDLDCLLAVPLLLSATDRVDLLICRDPAFIAHRPDSIAEEDEDSVLAEATV